MLVVFSSRAALAEPPPAVPSTPERIDLVYGAPPECPGAGTFHDEVRARVQGDWEAAPGELARRITISVTRRDEHYVAAIQFMNPQGQDVTRSVAGHKCEDVVNGIALVTALAIESRVEEALQQSEPEPAGAPEPKTTPVAAVEPKTPRAAAPRPAPSVPPPASRRGDTTRSRANDAVHLRFGAASMTSTGVGPDAAFGPALFATVELAGARLGLSGAALWSGLVHTGGVPARFQRLTARADGCPLALGKPSLSFEPCAFMELGSLHGQGKSTAQVLGTKGGSSLWAAPGLGARLLGELEPVVLVLELDGSVPLARQRFGVVTGGEAASSFKVPALVFGGELGVGIRL